MKTRGNVLFMSRRDRITYNLLMFPSFIILFALTLLPLIFSIVVSFTNYNMIRPGAVRFVGLNNFVYAFESAKFWKAVSITLVHVGVTVTCQMVLGMGIALLFSREFRLNKMLRSVYILPMMLTPVVCGIMWRMLFNTDYGFINYLLSLLRIPAVNWLGDAGTALWTIIITDIWMSTPFVTTLLMAGIQAISRDYYEAAEIDGTTGPQRFWYITLPLVKPMVFLALLFRVMDAIRRFDSIITMTNGGPGNATETLNLHAYFQGFSNFNIGYSSTLSFIMLVIIFSLSVVLLNAIQKAD